MYSAMLFLGWNLNTTSAKWSIDVGWASVWVKIVSEWVAFGLYSKRSLHSRFCPPRAKFLPSFVQLLLLSCLAEVLSPRVMTVYQFNGFVGGWLDANLQIVFP